MNIIIWKWSVTKFINLYSLNVTLKHHLLCGLYIPQRGGAQEQYLNLLMRNYIAFELIVLTQIIIKLGFIIFILYTASWCLAGQILIFCLAAQFLNWFQHLKIWLLWKTYEALATVSPHFCVATYPIDWACVYLFATLPTLLLH